MRVLLNKTLLLPQRGVSVQSLESKQRAELFFLCLRGLQVLGRARGIGKYTVLENQMVIERQPQTVKHEVREKWLL